MSSMRHKLGHALTTVSALYLARTGLSATYVGNSIGIHPYFFRDLKQKPNFGFNVRSYDKAMQWFSDRWPEDVRWPPYVERPIPRPVGQTGPACRKKRQRKVMLSEYTACIARPLIESREVAE